MYGDPAQGSFAGEIREGPDRQLYQWVEGTDGLGQPFGFWKAIKRAAGAVRQAAGDVVGVVDPVKRLFGMVVASNKAVAKHVPIPRHFLDKLHEYAAHSRQDGAILQRALRRKPKFYKGGWIMRLQPQAGAMTLDRAVFFTGSLSVRTYIHELVHVDQYRRLGVTAFLVSFFGISAVTVLKRLLQRKPLQVMKSSPHEKQAYAIDHRFAQWCCSRYTECGYCRDV